MRTCEPCELGHSNPFETGTSETIGPTLRPVTLIQFYPRPSVNGAENVQVSAVSKMDFTSHYSQSQIDQSHHPKKTSRIHLLLQ